MLKYAHVCSRMLTQVTDMLLEKIETYLSPTGRLYLVALDTNDPQVTASLRACVSMSLKRHVRGRLHLVALDTKGPQMRVSDCLFKSVCVSLRACVPMSLKRRFRAFARMSLNRH